MTKQLKRKAIEIGLPETHNGYGLYSVKVDGYWMWFSYEHKLKKLSLQVKDSIDFIVENLYQLSNEALEKYDDPDKGLSLKELFPNAKYLPRIVFMYKDWSPRFIGDLNHGFEFRVNPKSIEYCTGYASGKGDELEFQVFEVIYKKLKGK